MNAMYIIIAILALASLLIVGIAYFCFDDQDPDIDWHNNYAECQRPYVALKGKCPHHEKTDILVEVHFTCEEIWTVCDKCSEVLNQRMDC